MARNRFGLIFLFFFLDVVGKSRPTPRSYPRIYDFKKYTIRTIMCARAANRRRNVFTMGFFVVESLLLYCFQ